MRVQRISKLPAEPSSTTVNNYEALNIQLTYLLVQQMLFYLLHPHLVPCLLQEGDLGRWSSRRRKIESAHETRRIADALLK